MKGGVLCWLKSGPDRQNLSFNSLFLIYPKDYMKEAGLVGHCSGGGWLSSCKPLKK